MVGSLNCQPLAGDFAPNVVVHALKRVVAHIKLKASLAIGHDHDFRHEIEKLIDVGPNGCLVGESLVLLPPVVVDRFHLAFFDAYKCH